MQREVFKKELVLDLQSMLFPLELIAEIQSIWADYSLGNDYCYFPFDVNDYTNFVDEDGVRHDGRDEFPHLSNFLREHGVTRCLLHYWW